MKTNIFAPIWTILVLFWLNIVPLSAEQFGLFTYEVEGDSIAITDYPEDAVGEVEIPAEIKGKSVTRINVAAFKNCSGLTSVTIPKSVTYVSSPVFPGCSALESIVVMPGNQDYSSVEGVLFDASQAWLIDFPEGRMGAYAIPGGVTRIGGEAFKNCGGLTNVTIPSSVTRIDWGAFLGCTGLTNIDISGSVTNWIGRNFDFLGWVYGWAERGDRGGS